MPFIVHWIKSCINYIFKKIYSRVKYKRYISRRHYLYPFKYIHIYTYTHRYVYFCVCVCVCVCIYVRVCVCVYIVGRASLIRPNGHKSRLSGGNPNLPIPIYGGLEEANNIQNIRINYILPDFSPLSLSLSLKLHHLIKVQVLGYDIPSDSSSRFQLCRQLACIWS